MFPYGNQGLAVLKKNHLTGFHMIDTLDLPKFTSTGFLRIVFKSITVLKLSMFFTCFEQVFIGINYGLLYVYSFISLLLPTTVESSHCRLDPHCLKSHLFFQLASGLISYEHFYLIL